MGNLQQNVHIIPLGHEYDRAVKPFEKHLVNHVYILSMTEKENHNQDMISRQVIFTNKVAQFFRERNVEVTLVNVDLFDVLEVMKHISEIIIREKNQGNSVFVNMSVCSRKTSIGAALAGMANRAIVYYVFAERYSLSEESFWEHGLSICESGETETFENFEFDLPNPVNRKILAKLYREDPTGERGVRSVKLRDYLHTENVEGFEIDLAAIEGARSSKNIEIDGMTIFKSDGKTALTKRDVVITQSIKLEKNYIGPLQASGYIKRIRTGRNNVISITDSGKYVACITGMI